MPDKAEESRYEKYHRIGSPMAELPPVEEAGYLIDYLMEVGPVTSGGMSAAAISYSEIAAWSQITGTIISPWDAHMLRYLSRVYVNQYADSKDPRAPAPWQDSMPIEDRRAAVVAGLKALSSRGAK